MKVLLINDYIECGGAELQTKREMSNLMNHGDEVLFLSFDKKNSPIEKNINVKINRNFISKVYNKLFVNPFIKRKVKRIVKDFKPDFIHINNIFACPISVYSALNNYVVLQTMRDYGAVCPKTTCIYDNYSECEGYKYSNCKKCIKKSGFKAKFKNYSFNRINKYKFKCVNKFICPSEALTEKCSKNNHNIVCINNPFDFSKVFVKEKKICEKKTYLYYGMIEEIKGIYKLIEAFKIFSKDKDVELVFIGKIQDADKQRFTDYLNNNKNISYLGYMKNTEILEKFNDVYCVVVPSLWIENYPNTVLEPMANKTLVIGSNRGGIKGMIKNESLLFNITDINDIVDKLNYTYNLNPDSYMDIVNSNYEKVRINNTLDKYYDSLMSTYKSLLGVEKNE